MFKFMKSKKGFTLVELMIVVVIMAILVAVAVPIFSAVTKNAQEKTCNSNKREIISQVSNYCMSGNDSGTIINKSGNFTIESNGKVGTPKDGTHETIKAANVTKMFQSVPYCPTGDETTAVIYTVTLTAGPAGSTPTITVECSKHDATTTTTAK